MQLNNPEREREKTSKLREKLEEEEEMKTRCWRDGQGGMGECFGWIELGFGERKEGKGEAAREKNIAVCVPVCVSYPPPPSLSLLLSTLSPLAYPSLPVRSPLHSSTYHYCPHASLSPPSLPPTQLHLNHSPTLQTPNISLFSQFFSPTHSATTTHPYTAS